MGGNNTFAAGKAVAYRWETVGTVGGAKVLELKDKGMSRKLPEEAHSSRMYLMQHSDGSFVLHYHVYSQPGFKHGRAHRLSDRNYRRYKRFIEGKLDK